MNETQAADDPPAIRTSIDVRRPLDETFRLFTESMDRWWPLASHSVGRRDAASCAMEGRVGGHIFERTRGGDVHVWGTVLVWEPPRRLVCTWHPGRSADQATEVEIGFTAVGDGVTRIDLEHRGWATLGAQATTIQSGYVEGWDFVLGQCFGGFAGPPAGPP